MKINQGNYTFKQRLGVFLITMLIALVGIGGSILAVKLVGLAYLTLTVFFGAILFCLLILFYLLLFIDLGKKQVIASKVALFLSIIFISFVVFINLIESGTLNLDFMFELFK